MPPRVVFDTNILISALLSTTGAPFRCVALAHSGAVQSVTCQPILDELTGILRTKFDFNETYIRSVEVQIRSMSTMTEVSGILQVVEADPDDDMVVECAVSGQADYIVSGDKHLIAIRRHGDIHVLTANDLLALLAAHK